jgi:ApbE superfamily uncharacterized protein (UPF0280 family)
MSATRAPFADGRQHFQHGPIDLVIGAEGDAAVVSAAHDDAWQRFNTVLAELVAELPLLRRPVRGPCPLRGGIAQRMWLACRPHHAEFITPMAAVAGAVAQELIGFYQRLGISRAWVNNGGDIALHLAPGAALRIGLFADLARLDARQLCEGLSLDAHFTVQHELPVRGIATSGWRGRSFSLGIADSVTVLARTAADADAAATMIANAVNVDHPAIQRAPASSLKDDSDLGDLPVTVHVPPLPHAQVQAALRAGLKRARALQSRGLIWSAALICQGRCARAEPSPFASPRPLLAEAA